MNTEDKTAAAGAAESDGSAVEARLGQALGFIHRILAKLDEPSKAADIRAAFRKSANLLESAREAYEHALAPAGTGAQRVATAVDPEIAAVIAAAVAVLFQRPYRLVSVQQVATPVPHLNVWALEGRTQIFQSHKIR
jgi:hypothetical protein